MHKLLNYCVCAMYIYHIGYIMHLCTMLHHRYVQCGSFDHYLDAELKNFRNCEFLVGHCEVEWRFFREPDAKFVNVSMYIFDISGGSFANFFNGKIKIIFF